MCRWWPSLKRLVLSILLLHVHLFFLRFCCTRTCSFCTFIAHALVLVAPMLCTCFYYTSVARTPIFAMLMLCTCSCCSSVCECTCFCCAFVANLFLLHLNCTCTYSCCIALQVLTLLHFYIELFLNFWSFCVATMHYSLIHDLLALICYVTP